MFDTFSAAWLSFLCINCLFRNSTIFLVDLFLEAISYSIHFWYRLVHVRIHGSLPLIDVDQFEKLWGKEQLGYNGYKQLLL
jgi:hypothetical protein